LAGSLDSLNLDEVILPQQDDFGSHSSSVSSGDPTNDPLQVISDPSFPPFPILKEIPLTKPNVKTNMQEGNKKKSTSSTASTTTTTQKPLDWKRGMREAFKETATYAYLLKRIPHNEPQLFIQIVG
jgi:hypothetical protein